MQINFIVAANYIATARTMNNLQCIGTAYTQELELAAITVCYVYRFPTHKCSQYPFRVIPVNNAVNRITVIVVLLCFHWQAPSLESSETNSPWQAETCSFVCRQLKITVGCSLRLCENCMRKRRQVIADIYWVETIFADQLDTGGS